MPIMKDLIPVIKANSTSIKRDATDRRQGATTKQG